MTRKENKKVMYLGPTIRGVVKTALFLKVEFRRILKRSPERNRLFRI